MGILVSVVIGAAVGGLAQLLGKSSMPGERSLLAVGILGALLGTVGKVWLGGPSWFGVPMFSFLGAAVALVLWVLAQKMFVALPSERD